MQRTDKRSSTCDFYTGRWISNLFDIFRMGQRCKNWRFNYTVDVLFKRMLSTHRSLCPLLEIVLRRDSGTMSWILANVGIVTLGSKRKLWLFTRKSWRFFLFLSTEKFSIFQYVSPRFLRLRFWYFSFFFSLHDLCCASTSYTRIDRICFIHQQPLPSLDNLRGCFNESSVTCRSDSSTL